MADNRTTNLITDDVTPSEGCNLCREASLLVGQKTPYGAVVVYRIGNSHDGWFATLSPKTGGNVERDFTIQLMPIAHLTHFAQVASSQDLAKNYGIAFSALSAAAARVMAGKRAIPPLAETKEQGLALATYGKCTNWKEKKEHLHVKLFPFRGNIGQPYTVDSSFERKEVHIAPNTGERFVKMLPVVKKTIPSGRFERVAQELMRCLR